MATKIDTLNSNFLSVAPNSVPITPAVIHVRDVTATPIVIQVEPITIADSRPARNENVASVCATDSRSASI